MRVDNKEVRFDKFCNKCKYGYLKPYRSPCNECLEVGMREGTEVPDRYKEKEKSDVN